MRKALGEFEACGVLNIEVRVVARVVGKNMVQYIGHVGLAKYEGKLGE